MLKKITPVLALVLLVGCTDATITEAPQEVSTEEAMRIIAQDSDSEIFLSKGNSGKIRVCHETNGHGGDYQIVEVSEAGAQNHMTNHDGDGIIGVDVGEDCLPLPTVSCPCWSESSLSGYNFDDIFSDVDPYWSWRDTAAGVRVTLDNDRRASGNRFCALEPSIQVDFLTDDEFNACLADLEAQP